MSEALPIPSEAPVVPAAPQWDPFQLMDRMDEEALRRELDGVAATDLVYVVKEGGQEVVGLSKTGVDECCMALVSQGQVIREENLQCELLEFADGRDYLAWMAENFGESELRDFVRRILAGEEVVARRGRQLNPHWYEAGGAAPPHPPKTGGGRVPSRRGGGPGRREGGAAPPRAWATATRTARNTI